MNAWNLATPLARWYHRGPRPDGRSPSKGNPIRIAPLHNRYLPLAVGILTTGVLSHFPGPAGWGWAKAPPKVKIQGSVIDRDGHPVPDLTVRLLMTRNLIRPTKMKTENQVVEAARTLTDENGFFELEADRDGSYDKFFLRFYDANRFDSVRFRIPDDREITSKWKKKRPIIVTTVLEDSADWAEIAEWIDRYGAGSDPARILRSLGLPDRIVDSDVDGVVDWCFDDQEICYHLMGNEVLGQDPPAVPAAEEE